MAKTRAELVNAALGKLGALPAGQSPEAEDYSRVDGLVEPTIDDLAGRGITVASPDAIEDAAFVHLASILASNAADDMGVVGQEAVGLSQRAESAERKLRLMGRSEALDQPVKAKYY
jgi:hypothetical protein